LESDLNYILENTSAPAAQQHAPPVEGVDYEVLVSSANDTVWVNGADGSCIGRFSKRFGFDVHRTATAQMAGADQCLFCTHEAAGVEEWRQFLERMQAGYAITISEDTLMF
jgi:hypothetical protein